jgi:hypothetical protein
MKYLSIAVLSALFSIGAHAQVFGVKTVYLLPMAGGLDQYLALQLSSGGLLQVVTDPKKADAILTDGIGARLEDSLSALYGEAGKEKNDKNDKKDDDKSSGKAGADNFSHPAMQPLSRSRGVIFLVNRASRDVLWSTYELPSSTQPEELRHVAGKVVERLMKANTKTAK